MPRRAIYIKAFRGFAFLANHLNPYISLSRAFSSDVYHAQSLINPMPEREGVRVILEGAKGEKMANKTRWTYIKLTLEKCNKLTELLYMPNWLVIGNMAKNAYKLILAAFGVSDDKRHGRGLVLRSTGK